MAALNGKQKAKNIKRRSWHERQDRPKSKKNYAEAFCAAAECTSEVAREHSACRKASLTCCGCHTEPESEPNCSVSAVTPLPPPSTARWTKTARWTRDSCSSHIRISSR